MMINIFNSIAKGFSISAKKVSIVCKSVFVGFKIIVRYIFNVITSVFKNIKDQVIKLIKYFFRLYLSFESGIVKFILLLVSLLVKIRWGFIIVLFLTIIYYLTGIYGFLLSLIICIILMIIGYSDAKKEEDIWDEKVEKFNTFIERPLKNIIRVFILLLPFFFTYYFNTPLLNIINDATIKYKMHNKKFDPKIISAKLHNSTFSVNEAGQLVVIVDGVSAKPILKGEGFSFTPTGQAKHVSSVNEKYDFTIEYFYDVEHKELGTHTIKPITIVADGVTYSTQPITCTIIPASNKLLKQFNATSIKLNSNEVYENVFMRMLLETNKIYTDQPTPCTIKVYFPEGIMANIQSLPHLIDKKFILKILDNKPKRKREKIDNQQYTSFTWQGILTADKVGIISLIMELDIAIFRQTVTTRSSLSKDNHSFSRDSFKSSPKNVKLATPEQFITVIDR